MQFLLQVTGIVAIFCFVQPLTAQTGTDLRALLKNMNKDQKKMVLAYIQSQKDDLDQQIVCAFEQLDATAQAKTMKYAQATQPTNNGRPLRTMVDWNRDTLQIGTVEAGTIVLDSFIVTNTGQVPYLITSHKSACDCAVLYAPKVPLLPGEKATVRVEFNSIGKQGKIRTGIVLQDNSAPNARSILYIQGEVTGLKSSKKRPWED